jgi:hypothetical protein
VERFIYMQSQCGNQTLYKATIGRSVRYIQSLRSIHLQKRLIRNLSYVGYGF